MSITNHYLVKRMVNSIFLILLIIAALLPTPPINGITFRQSLGIEWLGLAISYGLAKRFNWSVGLCALWLIFECFLHPNSFVTLISLLFFICGALLLTKNRASFLMLALGFIAICDSTIIIYRYLSSMNVNNAWWVITSASLDGSFIALTIPIVLGIEKPEILKNILLGIMLAGIIFTRSNTALFVLVIMMASWGLASGDLRGKSLAMTLGLFALASALLFKFGKLFADQGRFANWKQMMCYWAKNINIWLGSGPGNYHNYVAKLQPATEQFVHMHNDLLEITFDQGLVGAASVLILYFTMLKRSFNRPVLFSTVVGFGFVSMTLFPSYLFFFQLLGVLLIYKCFEPGEKCPISV